MKQEEMGPTESHPELPLGWAWASLDDLALFPKSDIVDGPFGSNLKASEYTDSGLPIIRLQNIDRAQFLQKNIRFISKEKAEQLQRHAFVSGDIVITKLGDPLGKACIVPNSLDRGVIVADVVRVRVEDRFVSKLYLVFVINSEICIEQLERVTKGTTRPRVNLGHIRQLRIALAPLPEQRRIVEEIERRFSQLDAGVSALERAKANLKNYRASVLQSACEGRLVPTEAELARTEEREYEPADELLTRILKERRATWETEQLAKMEAQGKAPKDDKWKAKYKEPAGPDTSELPELPEGWAWTISDSVFTFVTSGSRGWAKYYAEEGALFLRVGNLDHNSIKLDLRDIQKVHPPEGVEGTRTRVCAGDILISITAEIGMIAFVPEELGEAYINQHVALARPVEPISKPYLAFYLVSDSGGQDQFLKLQRGAVKKGLGLDDIKAVVLPLPPLSEQHRIVAEVGNRFSILDKIEAAIIANLKRAERLRQAVLKQAFEGELVPQDPNDEPANVLLERIREERARKAEEEKVKRKPARKKMAKTKRGPSKRSQPAERRPLLEVLSSAADHLTPEQLFNQSGHTPEDIEDFYEELNREVLAQRIKQERPNDTEVYLRAVGE